MEIKIQIEKNLITEQVIGSLVSDQKNPDLILGKIISYDTITGIAICELINEENFLQDEN